MNQIEDTKLAIDMVLRGTFGTKEELPVALEEVCKLPSEIHSLVLLGIKRGHEMYFDKSYKFFDELQNKLCNK